MSSTECEPYRRFVDINSCPQGTDDLKQIGGEAWWRHRGPSSQPTDTATVRLGLPWVQVGGGRDLYHTVARVTHVCVFTHTCKKESKKNVQGSKQLEVSFILKVL